MTFELQHTDNASDARTGLITTDHGQIKTPIFMPVGTVGSVKGVHFSELRLRLSLATPITSTYVLDSTFYARQVDCTSLIHGTAPS